MRASLGGGSPGLMMAANPLRTRRSNMSKKTSSKTIKTATKKAEKAKRNTKLVAASECPKGGSHEWTEEEGEAYCSKCKEPKGTKAKRAAKTKGAKPVKDKKLSALDAAAKLLAGGKEPMNTKNLVES